jgi:hypothetical protein
MLKQQKENPKKPPTMHIPSDFNTILTTAQAQIKDYVPRNSAEAQALKPHAL